MYNLWYILQRFVFLFEDELSDNDATFFLILIYSYKHSHETKYLAINFKISMKNG